MLPLKTLAVNNLSAADIHSRMKVKTEVTAKCLAFLLDDCNLTNCAAAEVLKQCLIELSYDPPIVLQVK